MLVVTLPNRKPFATQRQRTRAEPKESCTVVTLPNRKPFATDILREVTEKGYVVTLPNRKPFATG